MLDDSKKQESFITQLFDTLFHLPTLLVLTVVSVVFVWNDLSLTIGEAFIRLDSNRGNVILHWQNGCCDVEW